MSCGRLWLRKGAMLLALCAASLAASALGALPSRVTPWAPDPDEQFILDVQIHQLRLGDPVRAYNTPEGTCVVLGDFLTALDIPIRIDLGARRATGWAFRENHKISIDYAEQRVSYGANKVEAILPGTIRETPEGWCVQTTALSRWFGIGVKPMTAGSVLMLQSDEKLPVELAMERQERASRTHHASFDLSSLPQVRIPYRMWRTPALDFIVSAGITYSTSDGMRMDRESSVYAAGEIAHLSYDAQVSTNDKGKPSLVRFRAFSSDPNGHLLGPLQATHVGVGDVEGFDSPLTGVIAAGRGAIFTNRPLTARTAFDRTRLEGDLPSGWEAEIYRNGELLGFAKSDPSQRYVFDNIELLYGENRIRVVLYGPQGQVRERTETLNVGKDDVPKGKTWYWVGANEPGRDLIMLAQPPQGDLPKAEAAIAVEHGLDSRTSVGVLARAMLIGDQRLTFVEGTVRRSVGPAQIELGGARESNGGTAAHGQLLGKFGGVYVNAEMLIANDFHLRGNSVLQNSREGRLSLDSPIQLGATVLPAHGEVHYVQQRDGTRMLDAAARLSASVERFNLGAAFNYHRDYASTGPSPPGEMWVSVLGSGHIGAVRIRTDTEFAVAPASRFKSVELSAYWTGSEHADWESDLVYDGLQHRARARITHILRFDSFALSLSGEAASDGALAFGFNLNFSIDPHHGLTLSRRPLAEGGMVHATVFRDLNDNGLLDPGEPLEKGAFITTGARQGERRTDDHGSVTVGGLTPFMPIPVGIDTTSLDDPMLTPKTPLQVVVPRPGVSAEVLIPLVGGGDVEGVLMKSGELGFEGVDLELVGKNGDVAATARTDFDGFFLFDRVPYGSYVIRVSASSAAAAKIGSDLGVKVIVSPDHPVVRLGSIAAPKAIHIAAMETGKAAH
ncbi:MAG TPA: hypothetical protein VGU01_08000 [Sphingomicrobium sp.]|nr:hypothetical protein [Sphingomicrobium sp.]